MSSTFARLPPTLPQSITMPDGVKRSLAGIRRLFHDVFQSYDHGLKDSDILQMLKIIPLDQKEFLGYWAEVQSGRQEYDVHEWVRILMAHIAKQRRINTVELCHQICEKKSARGYLLPRKKHV